MSLAVTAPPSNYMSGALQQWQWQSLARRPASTHSRAQQPDLPAVQMLGSWPGLRDFGANVTEQQRHQKPQAYNFSIPWKCHLTTVPQMSCTLSHLFAIFSAHQAGLVGFS